MCLTMCVCVCEHVFAGQCTLACMVAHLCILVCVVSHVCIISMCNSSPVY